MHLYSSLCVIRDKTARAQKKYNINRRTMSFRITLCILVILYVEIKLQIIQKSGKFRYSFNAFVLIFQRYSHTEARKHNDYNINE
jgi:hypothetical protein